EHLVGVTASLRGLVLHGRIALLGAGEVARGGEDHFAPPTGKALAAAGRAGLDDDGMALAGTRHGERSARLEELPLVIQPLHLCRIRAPPPLRAHDDRAISRGLPMAEHPPHELAGAVVAEVMLEMGVLAHVERLAVVERGDDVPCRAPASHEVEGLEAPRDIE